MTDHLRSLLDAIGGIISRQDSPPCHQHHQVPNVCYAVFRAGALPDSSATSTEPTSRRWNTVPAGPSPGPPPSSDTQSKLPPPPSTSRDSLPSCWAPPLVVGRTVSTSMH
ncbi:hypothetical protein E2C01_028713 [Portunus trituberculatus]|uniref:Uncharacterized protein n=1 Tax=Portunus trituberculatus TaxID=210409 RepID=A0A5B7ESI5_PORTR|nr:hypothetical protein [Portunus trituberculatus]